MHKDKLTHILYAQLDVYAFVVFVFARSVFGEAHLLIESQSGKGVVVKHVPLEGLDEEEVRYALNEVDALNTLSHPNIVRCLGSWVSPGGGDPETAPKPWQKAAESTRLPLSKALKTWETNQGEGFDAVPPSLNILTEFVDGGALDSLIARNGTSQGTPLEEELVGTWFAQIILAMEHMHKRKLLHRDIKPANIFITQSGLVKIGDLGCCALLKKPDETCSSDYGSPLYLGPEVWQLGTCSHKSDIWSVGCVVYELLAGSPPFEAPELAYKVLTAAPPPLPERYSAGLRELVFDMLQKDPEVRPSAAELLAKPNMGPHVKRWLAAAFSAPAAE